MECTLPQSFLSQKKQLSNIEKKTLLQLHVHCGFNRNISRAVLQGPRELGGGGFTPLNTVAGSSYIAHFLKFFRSPQEDAGKLIQTALAWIQYQSDLPYPILKHLWTPIQYVEGGYCHLIMA